MDDVMLKLLKQASDNPEYKLLTDYLMARRAMPEMTSSMYLGQGVTGSFTTPGFFSTPNAPGTRGKLQVLKRRDPVDAISTLVHELTHAADRQMVEQYFESTKRPGILSLEPATPFTDAMKKLRITNTKDSNLPKEFKSAESSYRASAEELHAFGMGSTVTANFGYPAPQHVDPTQATEVVTLLNLALKEMQQRNQSQGR